LGDDLTTLLTTLANTGAGKQAQAFLGQQAIDFARVPARLTAIKASANTVKATASARGDVSTAVAADALATAADQLQGAYGQAASQVADIASTLSSGGAPDLSSSAATAAAVGTILSSTDSLEQQVVGLGGTVAVNGATGTGVSIPWGKYLLYAGGVYVALYFLLHRGRRRR
jgi:hypothetical protein